MKNTKSKLLATAAKMFARRGMDGVSTRELAKAANVNLCAINYYFGSKQNLYEAVIDSLIQTITDSLLIVINHQSEQNNPLNGIKNIIGNFFDFLYSDSVSDSQAMLMINEIISPSKAYEQIYAKILEPVHKQISQMVASYLDTDEKDTKVPILTHTLFGQAVIFRIHKEALLRQMNLKIYDKQLLQNIRKHIEENCEAILEAARRNA